MIIGHWRRQISCQGKETFVGSNLVLQWVPGSGKVVRGDTKMSPGRVSPVVLQRVSLSAASIFITERLFIYIYFLLFEENHQNRISRAGEKISLTILLFSRKMIAKVLRLLRFSCAKRLKD